MQRRTKKHDMVYQEFNDILDTRSWSEAVAEATAYEKQSGEMVFILKFADNDYYMEKPIETIRIK